MKKIAFFIAFAICIFIIVSLVQSIVSLSQKQDLVQNAQQELSQEKKKNKELKQELRVATSGGFLEEQARDKLFMVKDGEKTIVIPDNLVKKSIVSGRERHNDGAPWKQWWDLFF